MIATVESVSILLGGVAIFYAILFAMNWRPEVIRFLRLRSERAKNEPGKP